MFTKKCALLRKNEELSKHAIRAVNSIIKKKTQERSLVELDDSFFDTGKNKTFYHKSICQMISLLLE